MTEESLREEWRQFLYGQGGAPESPRLTTPPLFKGRTPTGGRVEIRSARSGSYDVLLDGALLEHHDAPWEVEPERHDPVLVGGQLCEERFDASVRALESLADFVSEPKSEPPWEYARELVEDGLMDAELALTSRGARALETLRETSPRALGAVIYCVLAADSARARVFTLDASEDVAQPTLRKLEEVSDLANPALRARDGELFTETRPGVQRAHRQGPSHGVHDRRGAKRREMRRRFAELAVDEAARLWRQFPSVRVIVAASPGVLGDLRAALTRCTDAPRDLIEVARELANRSPIVIHDALADAGALPRRGRLPHPEI